MFINLLKYFKLLPTLSHCTDADCAVGPVEMTPRDPKPLPLQPFSLSATCSAGAQLVLSLDFIDLFLCDV